MKNEEQPIRFIDNAALYPVLTKREYFAAMALQGILSSSETISITNGLGVNEVGVSIALAVKRML